MTNHVSERAYAKRVRQDDKGFPWPMRSYPGKRALDVVLALAAILVASPVMLLIAVAVKLSSPGPILYAGVRSGFQGRRFRQLKFRTMVTDLAGGAFTGRNDPRVTTVGKFLRFFKLDEFPQFINILRGDMSVVGPRPEAVNVVEQFYTRDQLRVLSARPGLTCLVQVRTFPDLANQVPDSADPDQYYRHILLPSRLQEDLQYVDRMSMWWDLLLILQTAYCILGKSWVFLWRHGRSTLPRRKNTSAGVRNAAPTTRTCNVFYEESSREKL